MITSFLAIAGEKIFFKRPFSPVFITMKRMGLEYGEQGTHLNFCFISSI